MRIPSSLPLCRTLVSSAKGKLDSESEGAAEAGIPVTYRQLGGHQQMLFLLFLAFLFLVFPLSMFKLSLGSVPDLALIGGWLALAGYCIYYRYFKETKGFLSVRGAMLCIQSGANPSPNPSRNQYDAGEVRLSRPNPTRLLLKVKERDRVSGKYDRRFAVTFMSPADADAIARSLQTSGERVLERKVMASFKTPWRLPYTVVIFLIGTFALGTLLDRASYGGYNGSPPSEAIYSVSAALVLMVMGCWRLATSHKGEAYTDEGRLYLASSASVKSYESKDLSLTRPGPKTLLLKASGGRVRQGATEIKFRHSADADAIAGALILPAKGADRP